MAGSSSQDTLNGRQFKATQTWNVLVFHLKKNVNMKKRTLKKSCDHCFTGANGIDVLHQFVKNNREQFKNSSVSRENIVRLCQSFLDLNIVRRINESDCEKIDKYEDSSTALYVFIDESSDSNSCHMSGRQVLREIDGDIRNDLDHISISSGNKHFFTKHASLSLRPKRRPHFPSFIALGSSSQRNSDSNLEHDDISENSEKLQPPMKRSSSSVRKVVKRASSDPNLQQSVLQASSSSENEEEEKKSKKTNLRASVRLRFSQRLSFRKKSVSLNQAAVTEDDKSCSCNLTVELTSEANRSNNTHLPLPPELVQNDVTRSVIKPLKKSRRSAKRIVSTPTLFSKLVHKSQSYDVNDICPPNDTNELIGANTPNERCVMSEDPLCSPTKKLKKELIKDTPSRLRGYRRSNLGHAFTGLAGRVSIRRSLRKSERPTKAEQAYVLSNPMLMGTEHNSSSDKRTLSAAASEHLRRDCVRVRLLQLLDLSFIDDVIASPIASPLDAKVDDNDIKESFDTFASSFESSDTFVTTARALLSHLPISSVVLAKISKEKKSNQKLKLFRAILDYYKEQSRSFFPASSTNIVSAVVSALETKPIDDSLEIVQLLVHLLPDQRVSHLRDLIVFLRNVSSSDDVTLSSEVNNKLYVLQSFSSIIFPTAKNQVVSDLNSGPAGLVRFFLEESARSFDLPTVVRCTIKKKTQLMESGQIDSPSVVQDFNYSSLIATTDFEQQKLEFTQKQVYELVKAITSDSLLSSKKKKDFLKKLQSSHPAAYATLRPVKASHLFSAESAKKLLKPPGTGTLPRRRTKSKHNPGL